MAIGSNLQRNTLCTVYCRRSGTFCLSLWKYLWYFIDEFLYKYQNTLKN